MNSRKQNEKGNDSSSDPYTDEDDENDDYDGSDILKQIDLSRMAKIGRKYGKGSRKRYN